MTGEHWTPLPWYPPHLVDDAITCNCHGITALGYMGRLARVDVSNGRRIGDGGNDAPPLAEAQANARLMTASPYLYRDLKQACELLAQLPEAALSDETQQHTRDLLARAERVMAQARGERPFADDDTPAASSEVSR